MKKALLALPILFSSLAHGQAVEGTYIAPAPKHLRLLPEDFFRPRPQKPDFQALLKVPSYITSSSWEVRFQESKSIGYVMPAILSPESAKVELSVLRNSYHRLGEGKFVKRAFYAIKEGTTVQGNYNNVAIYYRSYQTHLLIPNSALGRYYYDRQTDPAGVIYRQLINAGKKALVKEFEPDAFRRTIRFQSQTLVQ
jgi:hypothetical protein